MSDYEYDDSDIYDQDNDSVSLDQDDSVSLDQADSVSLDQDDSVSLDLDDDQISICSGGVFSETASVVSQLSNQSTNNEAELSKTKVDLSQIGNKKRRSAMYQKIRSAQKKEKKRLRRERQKLREKLGEDAAPIKPMKTLENTREKDETMVHPEDQEVLMDAESDEMSGYFKLKQAPKVLLTTCDTARSRTRRFLKEFNSSLPNSFVYPRKFIAIKKIIPQCVAKGFTDLIIVNDDRGIPNGMLMCHLPNGPTAHFKLTNVKLRREIRNSANPTKHKPEIILNNFGTRLGHTIGRMLAALYPHEPQFRGRQVATYHNQRDFIFFRHHRYIFRNQKRVALQEIGPRFTLKLRSLQKGTFDSKFGEFEWIHKRHEMDTTRRRFHL